MKEQTHSNTREIDISTDVLVVGSGLTGLNTAVRIADSGYRVILVEDGPGAWNDETSSAPVSGIDDQDAERRDELKKQVKTHDRIEVRAHSKVVGATGVPGDFHIKLIEKDGGRELTVGAIVAATGLSTESLHDAYGLSLNDSVVSQTTMEDMLGLRSGKASGPDAALTGKSIVFLVGFGQEGNPIVTERVLKSVLAAEAIDGCTVHVCVGNIKVAGDGLERLYKDGRDKGASYYKLTESPQIRMGGNTPAVSFFDPVLREEMALETDMIVVEEAVRPDSINIELAELLRIDLGPFGFLQTDNVHRFPVNSNREGVFVVGPARDPLGLPEAWTDAGNAALAITRLLGDGKKTVPLETAVVDREKCAICLTCYRCCPHGAIYWDDKAVISPLACQACGTCASECPQDAIQVNTFEDDQIAEQVASSCQSPSSDAPLIVAFCCRNSAGEAFGMAETFAMKLPEGLRVVTMPCAGKIDIDYILTSFTQGAEGVLVITCHKGNCKSETGNIFAEWRVNDAKRMLAETGLEPERLGFETLASNMGTEFASIVNDMDKKLRELGTCPFKKAG